MREGGREKNRSLLLPPLLLSRLLLGLVLLMRKTDSWRIRMTVRVKYLGICAFVKKRYLQRN